MMILSDKWLAPLISRILGDFVDDFIRNLEPSGTEKRKKTPPELNFIKTEAAEAVEKWHSPKN